MRTNDSHVTQDIMNAYNTPGISIAVLPPSNGSQYTNTDLLTSTFGVGDCTDGGSTVDEETAFQAASISKPFTSLAVLQLVVQGTLNLDTDIEEYLALDKNHEVVRDDLHLSAVINPATAPRTPTTLRLLLGHESGLSTVSGFTGYYGQWATIPPTPSTINGINPSNNIPIRAFTLPGLGTSYSGGGTTVVQHILTLVTGKPFPVLMRELVLKPLGMTRSTYKQPIGNGQLNRVNYAKAHHNAYTGYTAGTECMIYPEIAAAGLWTMPTDILKGLHVVFDCLSATDDSFLPPALVAELFTEHSGFGGFGIGWQVDTVNTDEGGGKRRILLGHGGSNQGFECNLALVGDAPLVGRAPPVFGATPPVGVAWMSNSDFGPQIGNRILTALGWLFSERLTLSDRESGMPFFPVLTVTPAKHAKVAKQIAGWQAWKGAWQMKDGGDVAMHGPHVSLDIGEEEGLPTMKISVLTDVERPLVLLPTAHHHEAGSGWSAI
ncbi:beta-lactamase/transpeptidase-like protein [Mycena sp. CBHHK59/15]|nr:beta-lactamase/transpeptidase-like protein [Mycena sp. CBHHK59/15]